MTLGLRHSQPNNVHFVFSSLQGPGESGSETQSRKIKLSNPSMEVRLDLLHRGFAEACSLERYAGGRWTFLRMGQALAIC